jgi:hypothetical protein
VGRDDDLALFAWRPEDGLLRKRVLPAGALGVSWQADAPHVTWSHRSGSAGSSTATSWSWDPASDKLEPLPDDEPPGRRSSADGAWQAVDLHGEVAVWSEGGFDVRWRSGVQGCGTVAWQPVAARP